MFEFMKYKFKHFELDEFEMEGFIETYPSVEVWNELGMMDDWLESNPRRRKKNIRRFIKNWLKSEQRKASARNIEAKVGMGPSDYSTVRLKCRK